MRTVFTATVATACLLLVTLPPTAAAAGTAGTAARPYCNEKHPPKNRYYYKHRNHWDCVGEHLTCSREQRGAYGYSMNHAPHSRKLKCVFWTDAYRWKPVRTG
ncbi:MULTISPECIES: hypothetical protein [Streptosporangium]|uniref:Secreted protein n=1 Tax=Streptosporangium brasiliense TaxID=47480 RepID=A0ABT9RDQ0_9ACTN|nr:hypothetical protein [Streptosporangium brasiliense]MDP9867388.1 hypothetical protein [Streptosporangium brasiliense]